MTMQQLTFDFYNEPPPGASGSQANASPQETLATYRGKVYHLVPEGQLEPSRNCEGCAGDSKEFEGMVFCQETHWICIDNYACIWKEKT